MSFGHTSVKIPLPAAAGWHGSDGRVMRRLMSSSAAEVSPVQLKMWPPSLCCSNILEICKSYLQ